MSFGSQGEVAYRAYAEAALLNGTTTIFCDSHEIGNVCDAEGIEWMLRDARPTRLEDLIALGRRDPSDPREPFNTTYLAMRGCGMVNAVSRLHGAVSRGLQRLEAAWDTDTAARVVSAATPGIEKFVLNYQGNYGGQPFGPEGFSRLVTTLGLASMSAAWFSVNPVTANSKSPIRLSAELIQCHM